MVAEVGSALLKEEGEKEGGGGFLTDGVGSAGYEEEKGGD